MGTRIANKHKTRATKPKSQKKTRSGGRFGGGGWLLGSFLGAKKGAV